MSRLQYIVGPAVDENLLLKFLNMRLEVVGMFGLWALCQTPRRLICPYVVGFFAAFVLQ